MKQILIISLFLFCIAARHHKDDPVSECVKQNCQAQLGTCINTSNCLDVFTNCATSFQQNYDLNEFYTCLDQVPEARGFADCLIQNCVGVEPTESLAKFLNQRN